MYGDHGFIAREDDADDNYLSTTYVVEYLDSVETVIYICRVCHAHLQVHVAIFLDTSSLLTKEILDGHENLILGDGKHSLFSVAIKTFDGKSMSRKERIFGFYSPQVFSPFKVEIYEDGLKVGFTRIITSLLSIVHNGTDNGISRRLSGEKYLASVEDDASYKQMPYLAYLYINRDKFHQIQVIFEEPKTFNLISCDGVEKVEKFENSNVFSALLDPLEFEIWIIYGIDLIIFTLLSTIIALSDQRSNFFKKAAKMFETFSLEILENGPGIQLGIVTGLSKIKISVVYFLFGIWLWVVFFLNNLYKTILTCDEMTSVSIVTSTYTNISSLTNFTVAITTYNDTYNTNSYFGYNLSLAPFMEELARLREIQDKSDLSTKLLDLRNALIAYHPDNLKSILKFVSNCNKTAFITDNLGMNRYLNYFEQESGKCVPECKMTFAKGSDNFYVDKPSWIISPYTRAQSGYLYRNLQSLYHSGIYQLVRSWYYGDRKQAGNGMHLNSVSNNGMNPVAFTVQIISLFYLMGIFLAFAIVLFFLEIYVPSL